jgi:transcription-repair coupling factor (superfamily II helicase)
VKKVIASRPVDSFLDLQQGDYVVHVAHGIAKFTGVQQISKDGKSEEYLTLRFADSASLHVPAARINLIQKYVGGFSGHPQLSRLGGNAWEKQKEKVSEAVMDMAAELLNIQAARNAELGTSFPPDTEWQKEFEAEFPYEPTPDQITGAEEIKADMQRRRPMDRLLCGDVGYGKTELAMRAAFKAVENGRQVAVLVPTTVLAEQHYRSFRERMVNYPFEIESISRFKTTKEQRQIVTRAAAGEVDVLIGTHRLLSKDIKFADLGLVVVDEEQRFGVTHKERLKQMRSTVDVLTMSATPIPRTLHMSMLGLRDISSLTTAPQDRRSVVTEVIPFDRQRVQQAILREIMRGGQIYFVHNRVYSITEMADEIQRLVPEARILIGHGQMGDGEMEDAMLRFIRHEADVLVCTTIIESGLDIPNANTIIINNADRFGLSELHQLRGRVGRWKHRAYCYLLLPADRQRLDVYRRLTRCTSLEMCQGLQQDVKDAFGEPPRQVLVLIALTELRILAGLYGIDSIIKKDPDVVITVNDVSKAQQALAGAPGTLRVVDEQTIYLRMPPTFLESETCLLVLRNLMNAAYDRAIGAQPILTAAK